VKDSRTRGPPIALGSALLSYRSVSAAGTFSPFILRVQGGGSSSSTPSAPPIVLASERGGDRDIDMMNADGTGQTQLTKSVAWDCDPSWSPQ